MIEDELLKLRFKLGSEDALRRIYEKYLNYLLSVAMAFLNDAYGAEDVVHDVFVSLAQSADTFRLTGNLKHYLATCVANRARDRLRAARRLREHPDMEPQSDPPEDRLVCTERAQRIYEALAQLPDEQREAVVLRVKAGMRFRQIAEIQNVDQSAAATLPCAIDLDTGRIVAIPSQVLRMPAEGLMKWLELNGVDAIARMSDEGDGLLGVGLFFWTWMPSAWAATDPVKLREDMARASYQPRRPLLFQAERYQHVFPFKTREGGIGMLQMLAVDKAKQTVQFRYRMLREEGGDASADNDAESRRHAESVRRLKRFGLLACIHADHHDGSYPTSVEELRELAEKEQQDFRWIVDHVEYVGAGKTAYDPNPGTTVLAYDRTLLQRGKGTYAVFRDSHAEFIEPDRLAKYGLPAEP